MAASLFGAATLAIGGTNNAYAILPTPPASAVTALQPNVTYSTVAVGKIPANETQAGFVVGDLGGTGRLLQQASPNAINRLVVTIETFVNKADGSLNTGEKLSFRDPDFYLGGLPKECSYDKLSASNPKTITCSYRQTRPGFTFPAFAVFFNAPVLAGSGGDKISMNISLVYAEQRNYAPPRAGAIHSKSFRS